MKPKKILTVLLCAVFFVSIFPSGIVSAATEITGDGSENNPYLISTEAQLFALANGELTNSLSSHYILQNDIELKTTTWVPIGNSAAFSGVFDGNGYTVSGVTLEGSGYNYTGFFGKNKGTIKNLTVEVNFTATGEFTGGLIAYNEGAIINCLTEGSVSGSDFTGGLAGITYGAVSLSGSIASVSGGQCVGGLLGDAGAAITNCYAQGNVTGTSYSVGGLIGRNRNVVKNCYSSGKVNGTEGAGLIDSNTGKVYNSYYRSINTGNQTGFSLTADEMKKQSTFYMWDFENTWEMEEDGYPRINVRGDDMGFFVEFEGDGDAEIPYYIENEKQLYVLAMGYAKTGTNVYYQLKNDIAITAKYWTPIGEYESFTGIFDGNGYTISGISNIGTNYPYVGFFGQNSGTVKNLTVKGNISGNNKLGILIAYNNGAVENCLTEGSVLGSGTAGGLIGTSYGAVSLSGSTADVSGGTCVGGLIGDNSSDVTNCYAHGKVNASSYYAGGLIGRYCGGTIKYSYSIGAVSGEWDGGLIGSQSGTISSSYYDMETSGKSDTKAGTPLTTEKMKLSTSYAGWDFESVWGISEDIYEGYPYLLSNVPVEAIPVTEITLDETELNLKESESKTLTVTVLPENATNKTVTWSTSDSDVAEVTDGTVTAKSEGTAVITVTSADGGCTASCIVTVTAEQEVDENSPKITVSSVKTMPGNEIEVTVELENNTGFVDLGIEIGYNSDVLTLTNAVNNAAVGATYTAAQYYTKNPYNMGWAAGSNVTYNGNLATLTFTVKENAPDGVYPVTVDYFKGRDNNYTDGVNVNYDENSNAVGFVYYGGEITVISYMPGDINGDGCVDNRDVTYMLRYLAGWELDEIVTAALDTDGNSVVDNKDATHLLRYVAGWDVVLN